MTTHPKIVSEEAGHAAGLIWTGRLPRVVRADNSGPETWNGDVQPDLGKGLTPDADGEALAGDLMLCVLLGPLCAGDAGWPPTWKELDLSPWPEATGDLGRLSSLVRWLKKRKRMNEERYDAFVGIALHVADDANFKALHALIADALTRAPFITGKQLRDLLGPKLVASYLDEEAA
ncbi:MAG: hypothetical protein ACRDMH_00315 [Solirubrobacterales bacterium]